MDKQVLKKIENEFEKAFELLDDFDHQCLEINETHESKYRLEYNEAKNLIEEMKYSSGNYLFGKEKDESFKSSINTIFQTFNSIEVYPSLEEKAVNLLYFVVKNHSFIDGNKRIGAFLFLYFLEKNDYLFSKNNISNISSETLVAITVMIAISNPIEKEIIINLVMNLL